MLLLSHKSPVYDPILGWLTAFPWLEVVRRPSNLLILEMLRYFCPRDFVVNMFIHILIIVSAVTSCWDNVNVIFCLSWTAENKQSCVIAVGTIWSVLQESHSVFLWSSVEYHMTQPENRRFALMLSSLLSIRRPYRLHSVSISVTSLDIWLPPDSSSTNRTTETWTGSVASPEPSEQSSDVLLDDICRRLFGC